MRRSLAWPLGGLALLGFLRRRRRPQPQAAPAGDPRAEELRRKLAESRAIVEERDDFESAEPTVAETEHAPDDPDRRRRDVHAAAREAAAQMRERG